MKLFIKSICFLLAWVAWLIIFENPCWCAQPESPASAKTSDAALKTYLDFFDEVFATISANYFEPVSQEVYQKFLDNFKAKIYPQLAGEGKSSDFVRWRSAAYMVDFLKNSDDIFSAFFPPQFAEKYEKEVLGQRVDLGITGQLQPEGFLVTRVEPRSDAYVQGLREEDLILKVDRKAVRKLTQPKIEELLNPLLDSIVSLEYIAKVDQKKRTVKVISQEYFKQTVFLKPIPIKGIFCLELKSFNQKTSEDLFRFLQWIGTQGGSGLILDLRGNPGGPPLAAREIASFFLTPGEEFAYFQKNGQPRASLDVPTIPIQYRYSGPMVILVDKESGSAAELFSGVMQRKNRAMLIGVNTAGQVFLKSMFHFKDQSMVLLVTSRGYFPDGTTFSFQGLTPDHKVDSSQTDPLKFAAYYLAAILDKSHKAN